MFRFTIRDVLWLMVVVGMAVGWWIYHSRVGPAPGQLTALVSILKSHGVSVTLFLEGVPGVRVEASPNEKKWTHYQNVYGQGLESGDP